jgi:cytochrome c553
MSSNPMAMYKPLLALLFAIAPLLTAVPAGAQANDYSIVPEQFIYCTTCHGVELQGNRSVDAPRLNGMEDWYVRNQLRAFKQGWRGTHEDLIGMEMRPQAAILDAAGIAAAVAFVASVPARTPDHAVAVTGNSTRGKALYTSCAACHGDHAEGNKQLNAPRLTGQGDWYLQRQLEHFRDGIRGNADGDINGAQMRASITELADDNAIVDVVAYINSL